MVLPPQQKQGPPAGPRASRTQGHANSSRNSAKGGIQKRNNNALRIDKDGDLLMGAGAGDQENAAEGGRGARSTTETSKPKRSSHLARGVIDHTVLQKSVLRGMGARGSPPKGPRSSLRAVRAKSHGSDVREALQEISVTGLKQSKAAGNEDGGIRDMISFLERKSTNQDPAKEAVKIKKALRSALISSQVLRTTTEKYNTSRLEGDILVISVRSADSHRIIQLNGFTFAGANLDIKPYEKDTAALQPSVPVSSLGADKQNLVSALKGVIQNRYDGASKFLDLSRLGSDPGLVGMGMFESTTTGSKMFPALMKIIEEEIPDPKLREEAITSVSLADNNLLKASSVATLAQTFPALRNLDLSNNCLTEVSTIDIWRGKFPKLEHLILAGNPLETRTPGYKNDVLRWFPVLTTINTVQVRTPEDIKTAIKSKLPLPVLPASFRDEGTIGKSFLQTFFQMYDLDRGNLVATYYGAHSRFSLSVNTSAPRGPDNLSQQVPDWSSYIKRSRNLKKMNHLSAKMNRLHTGSESIREAFASLPATRHPSMTEESSKWCLECHAIPGLPDPTKQSTSGVGGLMVTVHGEFSEVNISTGELNATRSFDRTFILGPGTGPAGISVSSDILVLRSYGGQEGWQPDGRRASQQVAPAIASEGLAVPASGGPIDQVQKESMTLALSRETGLTLLYSQMCLEQSNWNLEHALMAFKQAASEGALGPECFVSG